MEKFLNGNAIFSIIMLVYYLIVCFIGLAIYILNSLALYKIAKRRKIGCYGLAWLPVLNAWIIGSIADHYDYEVSDKRSNLRTLLLIMTFIMQILFVSLIVGIISLVATNIVNNYYYNSELNVLASIYVGNIAIVVVMAVIGIVYAVFHYIALYKIYKSLKPQNAIMFLVLSIFLRISPFLLFAFRNKDEGFVLESSSNTVNQTV